MEQRRWHSPDQLKSALHHRDSAVTVGIPQVDVSQAEVGVDGRGNISGINKSRRGAFIPLDRF